MGSYREVVEESCSFFFRLIKMKTFALILALPIIGFCLYSTFVFGNSILKKFLMAREIIGLLEPSPALGTEWPKIPGPGPSDHVCVVGAGPSGVHMAGADQDELQRDCAGEGQ